MANMIHVFISICVVVFVVLWFVLLKTESIPLEEMAKRFGDEHETFIYLQDAPLDNGSSGHEAKKDILSNDEIHRTAHGTNTGDLEKGTRPIHVEV